MAVDELLRDAFLREDPAEAARVLEAFSAEDAAPLLAGVRPSVAAAVLERMAPSHAGGVVEALDTEDGAEVIGALDLDSAATLLRRVDPDRREALLAAVPPETRGPLSLLLVSPEGTAGALMDPRVFVLPVDVTVEGALERVRLAASDAMYYLYVVDRRGRLVGVLTLRELLLASPGEEIDDVMRPGPERLRADADRAAILAHVGWTEFHALPVVDHEGRFLGAIRYETLRRLAREDEPGVERGVASVMATLGELYWVGMTGVLEGLGHVAGRVGEDD